jgi:hypothetical protein
MDVAGDYLFNEYSSRKAMQRAEVELGFSKQLEDAPVDPHAKCRAL